MGIYINTLANFKIVSHFESNTFRDKFLLEEGHKVNQQNDESRN